MRESRLRIFASNRLETLLDALAAEMRANPLGPLEREVVVVQSRGMYRWVTLGLARALRIAATIATPFPGTFCQALAERVDGSRAAAPSERYEPAPGSPYERDALAWLIFALLGTHDHAVAGPAAAYLADDRDQQKRHQLATRLAERFDEYLLYRPTMLLAWEQGEQPITGFHADTARWQAALWRAVVARAGKAHPARRLNDLVERLRRRKTLPGLPPRVSVFGASSLPPVFLEVLGALAEHTPVSIYTVSPTDRYWADIRPERTVAGQLQLFRERGLAAEYAHAETGNRLLASLGRQGRELHQLLVELDGGGSAWPDLEYALPARDTVLGVLQADVAELVTRDASAEHPPLVLPRDDRSLQVHVCHSRMREMEVLRDLLLDAFARDPKLRPHDVLVLAPDISSYAPYIETVFGVEHEGEPAIPFTIADRSARYEQSIVDAALRILELIDARATASSVVDLLDVAAVRHAARIAAGEVATVREWVRATHIRWGVDERHRREILELPCDGADTWRAGLDRLLMGYAVGAGENVVAGILPFAGAGASEAALLGRFTAFADTLFRHLTALRAPRPLGQWARDLRGAFDDLIEARDDVEETAAALVRDALERLHELGARADLDESIELPVVRAAIAAAVDGQGGGAGFLTGAVTFCSLKPMRAIPAKLVCIAGLDGAEFPRRDRRASFDLLDARHEPGDRSQRDDDRYLFLETVLATRERLILSYVGRSQRDNREIPPSSVLLELLDEIDKSFVVASDGSGAEGARPRDAITVVHPLQPFSERYFAKGERLFSYSRANRAAAESARVEKPAPHPFVTGLGRAETDTNEIALADLMEFWVNPSRFFCQNALGLRLGRDERDLEESEPFTMGNLEDYRIGTDLVQRRLRGADAGTAELMLLRARGDLPHAGFGTAAYDGLRTEVEQFTSVVTRAAGGTIAPGEPITIDLVVGKHRLTGTIENPTDAGVLRYRLAKLKPKDYIRAWIPHLAATLHRARTARGARGCRTLLIGKDATVLFGAVADVESTLESLLATCAEGSRRAVPLFERASHAYAEQQLKIERGDAEKSPLECAKAEFEKATYERGKTRFISDRSDPYVALCVRDRDPFKEDVEEIAVRALQLWRPILGAAESVPR
jgi:exodeoxyribonuclease V gamma subunit